jgi:hypothetical protein
MIGPVGNARNSLIYLLTFINRQAKYKAKQRYVRNRNRIPWRKLTAINCADILKR